MSIWHKLDPAGSAHESLRRQRIVDFWMELDAYELAGGRTWEALINIRHEVTDSLFRNDLGEAESFTAQALIHLDAAGW